MTQEELEHIKEFIFQANQSGKQETSQLAGHLKDEVKSLKSIMSNYIEQDTADKEKIFTWQANATPAIEIMKNFQGFVSTGGWILKGVLLVGGAVGVLYGGAVFIRNYIKHL